MQQLASQTGGQFINVTNTAAVQAAFKTLAESIPVSSPNKISHLQEKSLWTLRDNGPAGVDVL